MRFRHEPTGKLWIIPNTSLKNSHNFRFVLPFPKFPKLRCGLVTFACPLRRSFPKNWVGSTKALSDLAGLQNTFPVSPMYPKTSRYLECRSISLDLPPRHRGILRHIRIHASLCQSTIPSRQFSHAPRNCSTESHRETLQSHVAMCPHSCLRGKWNSRPLWFKLVRSPIRGRESQTD